ncbi:hypothetical protein PG993_010082 [Apiospora rasikravindrae]|uniref:Uncharacterized protein n=1 Tax=Apiospora rasikravindrae TaxID=990691 RepID=A0ABR1SL94_9PEZI
MATTTRSVLCILRQSKINGPRDCLWGGRITRANGSHDLAVLQGKRESQYNYPGMETCNTLAQEKGEGMNRPGRGAEKKVAPTAVPSPTYPRNSSEDRSPGHHPNVRGSFGAGGLKKGQGGGQSSGVEQ